MKKNKSNNQHIELLAPAGSYESMTAAVNAGADAVYMGGQKFGARAYADNPQDDGLLRAIDYMHLHDRRLYLTVNTLLKEAELEAELYGYLEPLYEQGLDGVIVQDYGVMQLIRSCWPKLPLHISTQATICGPEGGLLMKQLGASRLVLPRELSLREIRAIYEATGLELEVFIHGALCYCYSGQCLMSSLIGGRSGNRGRCAQPCRLPYEGGNLLNLKDLCTLPQLPDIIEAGAVSLKIEGRMKSPRYTAGVVSVYRKYLDKYLSEGRDGYRVEQEDLQLLAELFDRGGRTDGYLKRHNGADMIFTGEKPPMRIVDEARMRELDERYVLGEKQEKIKGIIRIEAGKPVIMEAALRDVRVTLSGEPAQPAAARPLSAADVEKQLRKTGATSFVWESLATETDEKAFVPVGVLNRMRRELLGHLERAVASAYRREPVPGPQQATGGREAGSGADYDGDSGSSVARENQTVNKARAGLSAGKEPLLMVSLEHMELFPTVLRAPQVAGIYLPFDRISREELAHCVNECHRAGKSCLLALPYIFRDREREALAAMLGQPDNLQSDDPYPDTLQPDDPQPSDLKPGTPQPDGYLVRSADEAGFLSALGLPGLRVFDAGIYGWNTRAAQVQESFGADILTDSYELTRGEQNAVRLCPEKREMVVYGRLPMMISAQCVEKTRGNCRKAKIQTAKIQAAKMQTGKMQTARTQAAKAFGRGGERSAEESMTTLTDRRHVTFPVDCRCRFCTNIIYNSVPLWLLDRPEAFPARVRVSLTTETAQEAANILASAASTLRGEPAAVPSGMDITRGHFRRGVQ